MFRVASYQRLLRILLVSGGLVATGAFAQDQAAQPAPVAPKDATDQKAADRTADPGAAQSAGQAADQPAQDTAGAASTQPADDAVDPLKRPPNEKQKKRNQRALKSRVKQALQEVARRGRHLDHHRRRACRLQAALQRRRARQLHRSLLAAPRPDSRHRRERVQGRALPAHRLCQRAFRRRRARMEDGSRPYLHRVRQAGRDRIASLRRHLRAAHGRRRRRDLDLPV